MKNLLLIVAVLFSNYCLQAQELKFGLKAGVNAATLFDNEDNQSNRTFAIGFHAGGFAEIGISPRFAVQPEILYSQQGVVSSITFIDVSSTTFKQTSTTTLGYINIPVMAKYFPVKGFSLQAGPQLGYLLTAKTKIEPNPGTPEVDAKESLRNVDFGVNLGAGYLFVDTGLFFDARYCLGLTQINKEGSNQIKNGVIQVSVGYKF